MKYFMCAIILSLLSSCSAILSPIVEKIEDEVFIDYRYLEEDLNTAWKKTASFRYDGNIAEVGNWKSPIEFIKNKGGNCADFANYLIYRLGKEANYVAVYMVNKKGETIEHAIVYYKGLYIEPGIYKQFYTKDAFTRKFQLSYDASMKLCTNFFTK